MGNAAVLIDNQVDAGSIGASSQVLTMPASNLFTPHPSQRWRSLSNADFFVLDKRALITADTLAVGGMTCGPRSALRVRLSAIDSTAAAGEVFDGSFGSPSANFDTEYGTAIVRLPSPAAWRYSRVDIADPDGLYVEAGFVVDGLSEEFEINFAPGAAIQHVDRSRVGSTSAGLILTWSDNTFRRVDLSFDWVTAAQRYGVVQRMDRRNGRHKNVLLFTDTGSDNLPRDTVFGLITDITPVTFTTIADIFGKQLRLDERL